MKKQIFFILLISLTVLSGCSRITGSSYAMASKDVLDLPEHSTLNHTFVRYPHTISLRDRIILRSTQYTYEPEDPEQLTEYPVQSDEIDPSKPMIALTFDDGPGEYTAHIIDLLNLHNVRATFCIIGEQAESKRDMIIHANEVGCEIIGHTWSHRKLTKLSAREIEREILDTYTAIDSIIGAAPQIYRAPYGAINNKVREASKKLGFSIILWSVDPRDWESKDADLICAAIMENITDGAIILCHDTYEATAKAMERIIPELIVGGYQLVTVSELVTYNDASYEPGGVYRNFIAKRVAEEIINGEDN